MYDDIAPLEFKEREAGPDNWRLLDVREGWELDIASVDGSLKIPMGEIPERIGELDPTDSIAVICHSGVRSARVATFLVEQGFKSVANITGGIDAWATDVDGSVPRY